MATAKLTDTAVKNAKPPATGSLELWDSVLPGFGVRIGFGGKRSFQVMVRVNGRLIRRKLGTYPVMTLAKAREEAQRVFREAASGIAPKAAQEAAALTAARAQQNTFAGVAAAYMAERAKDLRSKDKIQRLIDGDLLPAWATRDIRTITRRDIKELVIRKSTTAPIAANRLLALISVIFTFALDEEFIDASPAVRIKRPGTEVARERVLTDAELRDVWLACGRLRYPFGQIFRLALLTGQRLGEVAGMRRSEIVSAEIELRKDEPAVPVALWKLPGDRIKGGKGHVVYLAPLAREVLASMPAHDDALFSVAGDGDRPATEFSRDRRRLYDAVNAVRRERGETEPMPDWRPHDLRRTCATGMRTLRIDRLTVSKVLNHAEGGITQVYDRYTMDAERYTAWEAWARKVESIIRPGPDNVVQMPARA
jgi:integrase